MDFQVWLGLQQFAQRFPSTHLYWCCPVPWQQATKSTCSASLGKSGSKENQNPSAKLELHSKTVTSGSVSPSSLLGATPAKMCAVLNLSPANLDNADVMYSRLSPCFTKRKKGSCTGAGQLANFLVLRRLAQL